MIYGLLCVHVFGFKLTIIIFKASSFILTEVDMKESSKMEIAMEKVRRKRYYLLLIMASTFL